MVHRNLAIFLAFLPVPAQAGGVERADDRTLLVLNLRPMGVSAEEALAATAQLAERVAEQGTLEVVTVDEINELVAYQRNLSTLGCADETCIAEMSRLANAARALSGSIGRLGERYVLNLTLLDVARSESVGSVSRSFDALGDLIAVTPGALAELFGWEGAPEPRTRFRLPAGQTVSLAVFDLEPLGVSEAVAANLTQLLAVELKRIEGTQVVSRDDIASMVQLEAEKAQFECTDDMSCLAEIGGALGVQKLVVGHAGKLGEQWVVALRLIDVRRTVVENRVSESFAGGEDQLAPAVRVAGWRLLGIEPTAPGTLALATSEQEVDVFLDGENIGRAPMPPRRELSPGRHSLLLSKTGFVEWRSDFYVEPNGTTPVWAEVIAEPPPFYATWWFWTLIGAAVVGGTTATVIAVSDSGISTQASPLTVCPPGSSGCGGR